MQTSQQMQAKINIPPRYLCPITQQIMIEPVFATDGRTYEREAIAEWLKYHDTSPITNRPLKHKELIDNFDKRSDISEYLQEHPELYQSDELYLPQSWIKEIIGAIKAKDLKQVEICLHKDKRLLSNQLENEYTAWHLACERGNIEMVNLLLKQLSKSKLLEITQHNPAGFKPHYMHALLENALNQNDIKQAEILLELGADLEQVDINRNTLLHRLVIKGKGVSVAWLLERKPRLDVCNNEGNTPLLLAVLHNYNSIVRLLINMGANSLFTNNEKFTPVAVALLNDNQSILKLLLNEKLSLLPPLHLALELNDIFLLSYLLEKNQSNIEAIDAQGCTVLWLAIAKDNFFVIDLLLAKGANPSASCIDKRTPLHLAVMHNNKAIVEKLLQAKLNIDAADSEGNTPLHLAAKLGNNQVLPLLLKAGANHKARNNAFKKPLKLAISANKPETTKLIEQTLHKLKQDRLANLEEIEALRQKISDLESALVAERKARSELCSSYETKKQYVVPLISNIEDQVRIKSAKQILPKFLRLVAEGEQDQAEAMLQENLELGLLSGNVTDLSKRSFNNITGLQYAVWALDWHMWTMLLKYLKPEAIAKQLKDMETGSWVKIHGKSVSWQNLIDALDTYISLGEQGKWKEAIMQWNIGVGDAQGLLPVHVVNEYCYPNRFFVPCPNFKDKALLPRSRKTSQGEWFTAIYNDRALGIGTFAYIRGEWGQAGAVVGRRAAIWKLRIAAERHAMVTLLKNRVGQQQALFTEYLGNQSQAQFKLK